VCGEKNHDSLTYLASEKKKGGKKKKGNHPNRGGMKKKKEGYDVRIRFCTAQGFDRQGGGGKKKTGGGKRGTPWRGRRTFVWGRGQDRREEKRRGKIEEGKGPSLFYMLSQAPGIWWKKGKGRKKASTCRLTTIFFSGNKRRKGEGRKRKWLTLYVFFARRKKKRQLRKKERGKPSGILHACL